jgi:hypothetical protein
LETPQPSTAQVLPPQQSSFQQLGETLGDTAFGLGQAVTPYVRDVVKGLTNSLVENTFKGTSLAEPAHDALHPNEPIEIRKSLAECTGTDGEVNQRVLDCMHGK